MNWIEALSHCKAESKAHVLMTILDIRGSSPRDVGTKMVVSTDTIFDTIGGGALEHQCIETAWQLLLENKTMQHTETYNLGTDLKQCCGGVISVFFEVFPAINFHINLFGAGHVGQALIKVLENIDCRIYLYDTRAELIAESYPSNVKAMHLRQVEIEIEHCKAEQYYLVMTHDHALDQQLCEAILSRNDSLYCGVIGSPTKGLKFKQRLMKKGFTAEELRVFDCPIGLSGLKTKKPAEIAISVAAELLQLNEKYQVEKSNKADDQSLETLNNENVIQLGNSE